MIGGINKLLRNFSALRGKDAFEKHLIKATYTGDSKEPKEKHVAFLLDCLRGAYTDITTPDAVMKLLDRYVNNLKNWSLTGKVQVILHRALLDKDSGREVANLLKENENMLYTFQRKTGDSSFESKMHELMSELYISYIKSLVNFLIKC